MSPERFDHLLGLTQEKITRKHYIGQPISAEERLAITLRYLASGDSQQSIAFVFKVGHSTVNGIINEVCDMLWNSLFEYVTPPSKGSDWKKIVADFQQVWNMPHYIGAIDGKHIAMKNLRSLVPYGIITKGFSGWFCLQYAMLVTVLQQ